MDFLLIPKKEEEIEPEQDVIIIGGGPAGLTAGIYTGRARLKTLLIEESLIGGLAALTAVIENYPGFPEGITGKELSKRLEEQAKKFGTKILEAKVLKLS
ncbi:MAG: FAD-dependent oxidoreductase, partial [Dictyoglomaceae bacterium]|nr:FAD-dependent oxidoreductase [Dictyoglomaceae bacterium]